MKRWKPRQYKEFEESLRINMEVYQHYYDRLFELAISMFKWSNLPETIDERFIEFNLFTNGTMLFFKDDVIGYLCLKATLEGELNVYGIPIKRTAYASNDYMYPCDDSNSVIIYNNMIHTNSMNSIETYARKLYQCDRIIDVNIRAQKTPLLITCPETMRLTMKNMYQQYDGNQPVIWGNKNLDPHALNVVNTNAPFVADKINLLKKDIWNDALNFLGIRTPLQKRERIVATEAEQQESDAIANRYSRLNARQQACEQINKMFGLDIWCEYRPDLLDTSNTLSDVGDINE